jgi:hypothetical protein
MKLGTFGWFFANSYQLLSLVLVFFVPIVAYICKFEYKVEFVITSKIKKDFDTAVRLAYAKNSTDYQIFGNKVVYFFSPSLRALTAFSLLIYPYELIVKSFTGCDANSTLFYRDVVRLFICAILIKVCANDKQEIKDATF